MLFLPNQVSQPSLAPSSVRAYLILSKSSSCLRLFLLAGDVGLSPASSTFLTGFSLTENPTTLFSTSIQVTGSLFAADYTSPTPTILTTAVLNMQAAFNDGATRANPNFLNLASGKWVQCSSAFHADTLPMDPR